MPKSPDKFDLSKGEIESKEKEQKPFFFVYRENDLFKAYVPLIQKYLEEQGYSVTLQSFPAGTPEEKINDWCLAHQKELLSKNILADNTSERSSNYNLKANIDLDRLMLKAARMAITGTEDAIYASELSDKVRENLDNPEKLREAKQEYLFALGEAYKKILTSIPEEKRRKMEVVILRGLCRIGDKVFPSLMAHEPYALNPEKNFEESQKHTDEFVNLMKEWFIESGIPDITIFTTGAEIPPETMERLVRGKAFIVFDRHTKTEDSDFWGPYKEYSDMKGPIRTKAALQTPLETFYYDVRGKIGMEADPQKMEEPIKELLQKELAKIEKIKNT